MLSTPVSAECNGSGVRCAWKTDLVSSLRTGSAGICGLYEKLYAASPRQSPSFISKCLCAGAPHPMYRRLYGQKRSAAAGFLPLSKYKYYHERHHSGRDYGIVLLFQQILYAETVRADVICRFGNYRRALRRRKPQIHRTNHRGLRKVHSRLYEIEKNVKGELYNE